MRDSQYVSSLLREVDVVVNAMAWSSLYGHGKESHALFYLPVKQLITAYENSSAVQFINLSSTAATPKQSADAHAPGVPHDFWPHMKNVINIENDLQKLASDKKSVMNLRVGIFVGEHYALGLLPILLPRLKTHLVPWVQGGNTPMALIDGRDIGQAMGRAALTEGLQSYESMNVVGKTTPTVREVITFLNAEYHYPKPHFSVPFWLAYPFAWLMEKLNPVLPWEPLIVRSIIHLLEHTFTDNDKAAALIGYHPQYHWHDAVRRQIAEMDLHQTRAMSMVKAIE